MSDGPTLLLRHPTQSVCLSQLYPCLVMAALAVFCNNTTVLAFNFVDQTNHYFSMTFITYRSHCRYSVQYSLLTVTTYRNYDATMLKMLTKYIALTVRHDTPTIHPLQAAFRRSSVSKTYVPGMLTPFVVQDLKIRELHSKLQQVVLLRVNVTSKSKLLLRTEAPVATPDDIDISLPFSCLFLLFHEQVCCRVFST